jgi:hypothetical protein
MTHPGPLAEEAAKLVEALQQWASSGSAGGLLGGLSGLSELPLANGSPECRLCPVCTLIGLARNARPETFEHLLDAAGSLTAALRSAIDAHEKSWAARTPSTVERIDVE